jgi:hypothetical protein
MSLGPVGEYRPTQDFNQPQSVGVGFGGKAAPPAAPQPFI